jgi:hypothetical protein
VPSAAASAFYLFVEAFLQVVPLPQNLDELEAAAAISQRTNACVLLVHPNPRGAASGDAAVAPG